MLGAHYEEGSNWRVKLGLDRHLDGGVAPLRYDLARAEHEAEQRARRLETAQGHKIRLPATGVGSLLRAVVSLASLLVATHMARK